MSKRSWTRSLYWRIGLGFIVFLAITLVAQVGLFVWVAGATEGGMPERMGRDFAELIANEFEAVLAREPNIDLEAYAKKRVVELHRPTVVMFADGRMVAPPDLPLPMLPRMGDRRFGGPGGPGGGLGPGGPGGPGPGPGARMRQGGPGPGGGPPRGFFDRPFWGPRRVPAMAPVRSNGQLVATIWVPPLTGASRVITEFGSFLALGVLLLIAGTVITALMIFRPAHAQLRALEDAARRFGDGDLTARAPEIGGDEVAAVAAAFNRMAADLAARQAQLAQADRVRRQLLADVSHELMTPLTAIRGYAETLALPQFSPAVPEGQRAVRIILEEGERIERLVGDLLDLARFEAGGISLAVESVLVDDLFERVSERHDNAAHEKGVAIVIDPHDDGLRVKGDPHRLEQALQNLASNALRHTPPGGTITLSARRDQGAVKLRVADTGVGIPLEHQPHVFDRFYKADQSRSQIGSGLGLSIVKAIVERHGGTVSVSSTPGVATVFEIALPDGGRGL
ncbi:MAG: HAMP domain-containing sensor histidine kinase [Vicinamibacterales bacterium]